VIAAVVYALCAGTSLACSILLYRGYRRSASRLLLWSALCFAGLFLNNAILIVDMQILPDQDLSVWRTIPALAGISFLVYGLIAESR
jgi:drug/metabolite transporter (DMT)-like permease